MKPLLLASVAVACAATAMVAAQMPTPTPAPSTPRIAQSAATKTMTLGGCIMPGTTPEDPFMLSNPFIVSGDTPPGTPGTPEIHGAPATADGETTSSGAQGYRLSGSDLSPHVGKRVQIVGGLVPSANAAATAGAASSGVMGPTGMSGAGAAGIGMPAMTTLPELRVLSVKPLDGPCPPVKQ